MVKEDKEGASFISKCPKSLTWVFQDGQEYKEKLEG